MKSLIALIVLLVLVISSVMVCIGNDTGDCDEPLAKWLRRLGGLAFLACIVTTVILKF